MNKCSDFNTAGHTMHPLTVYCIHILLSSHVIIRGGICFIILNTYIPIHMHIYIFLGQEGKVNTYVNLLTLYIFFVVWGVQK